MAQENQAKSRPVVISTWRHGLAATEAAWKILSNGGRALDAIKHWEINIENLPGN